MECEICLEEGVESKFIFLICCGHFFHKECLESQFNFCINEKRLPIVCPHASCQNEREEVSE